MAEWVICILLSSISGSILYVIWKITAKLLKREDFLYAVKCGIHLVVIFFFIIMSVSIGVLFYISLQPGKIVWPLHTVNIRNIMKGLFFIWTCGAIFKICLYMLRCHRLRKLSKTYIPCDLSVKRLFEDLCDEMEIKKRILVVQSISIPIARIEGILHPCICIPVMEYKESELRIILKHELVHYLNHDRWIRGCSILLECIYWFNPLVALIHHSLESWDEYYCDYLVCHRYGVGRKEYLNTLAVMADRMLDWKEKIRKNMVTAFFINSKNLKKRIERIIKYTGQKKQKIGFSIIFCGFFVLTGCVMTFFWGVGAMKVYAKMIETTYENNSILETEGEEAALEEYRMPQEENPFAGGQTMGDETIVYAEPMAVFSAALQDEIWKSGLFKAYSGQNIYISVTGTPNDAKLKVGILEPDGVWRFVYSSGNIAHTFKLSKSGNYLVLVWNEPDTEVKISGYYATSDSE